MSAEFALFPLTAHVLPGGMLPLRIFEPRYVRMVKEAASGGRKICMCMLDASAKPDTLMNMFPLATEIEIVDFDALPDGLLGITVRGIRKRRLNRVWAEPDGLKVGFTEAVEDWHPVELPSELYELAEQLRMLYEENESLHKLALEFDEHNATWLCHRWLELLPLNPDDKQLLLEQPDCNAALAFLNQAIKKIGERQ
ncbi:LON peptidase substrate-binding domain-containing protein [Echinimonas agarilytica]|uniref:LON peptidase substrate-binding domain-containing protein n=1 Tax=Echinimonas agarilytica TaxID=1215918 RepID=A0AA41W4G6_9GAMM|nr:LON peptidase substrate-binding domain-containing protein [Echinimonas agarilytica]MCM2678313.1 LON peptidase substrate-binding domain-containing protein [Echinimonas agarilytica]